MRYSIATLAAAAVMVAAVPSFAAANAYQQERVPESVILKGPTLLNPSRDDDAGADWAMAEIDYLQKVCPTVLASPGSYSPTLDQFCHEPHG